MKFFEYFLTIPLLFVKQTKRKKELIIENFHFCSIFLLNSFKFLNVSNIRFEINMNHFKSNVDQHTINMHFLCSINKTEKKT